MSVAENVKRLRLARGMTQAALGEKVGVGRSYIAQVERGSKIPGMYLGEALAEALGVTANDLLRKNEEV